MLPTVEKLLQCLPPYCDEWVVVKDEQNVYDIIEEILKAHKEFAPYYDNIALYFDGDTTEQICKNIYRFLKWNIKYKEEGKDDQTTALPAGILTRMEGDCKHYSSFAGGVLDALNRVNGTNIDWHYRFASYDPFDSAPHHVFVTVWDNDRNEEIWIDPTPGAKNQVPVWLIDKKIKVKPMALRRNIAGFDFVRDLTQPVQYVAEFPVDESQALAPDIVQAFEEQQAEEEPTGELQEAINVLYHYKVLNDAGEVSDIQLQNLAAILPQDQFDLVSNARLTLQLAIAEAVQAADSATIGSFFSSLWRGVKKVSLAVPRNAFLSLVALNVFGYATKLYNAIYKEDGSYWQPGQDNLYKKWNKLGGDWSALNKAIKSGHSKKAILGCVDCGDTIGAAAAAVPAWVATASAIIAAIMPLVKTILQQRQQAGQMNYNIDPATGLPVGMNMGDGSGNYDRAPDLFSNPIEWIRNHPLESAIAAGGLYYLFLGRKKVGAISPRTKKVLLVAGGVGAALLLMKKGSAEEPEIPAGDEVVIDTDAEVIPETVPTDPYAYSEQDRSYYQQMWNLLSQNYLWQEHPYDYPFAGEVLKEYKYIIDGHPTDVRWSVGVPGAFMVMLDRWYSYYLTDSKKKAFYPILLKIGDLYKTYLTQVNKI